MGLLDRFRKVQSTDLTTYSNAQFPGSWQLSTEEYERILGLSPGDMWRTQPYLRTVVTFLARNIAQLGLHTFERVDDNDRRRVHDGGMAEALKRPNPDTTTYELVYGLVADLGLYDVAYWLTSDDPENRLTRLPVPWVKAVGGDVSRPDAYDVKLNDRGERVRIPADQVLAFHGWHPGSLYHGSSPVHALKEILAEQVQAAKYREHVWRRGGKVGAVLSRPPTAPEWSPEARAQFKADWDSKFTGSGPQVGGTPLLEDGMTLSRVDFSAHEMEFVDGARLALNTVASTYHVNPTMIGLLDNANYSNVREFRRMLYGDTLGPIIAQIEDRLNAFLLPRLDTRPNLYVEFNIEEKLKGSFEEQTAALQSSVGRPWMTANEARALRNMPAIDGGEELVTPLNVLVGGQASPRDSAPEPDALPAAASRELGTKTGNLFLIKERATQRQVEKVAEVLRKFFARQGATVLSKINGGGDWWDGDRWDKELARDLGATALAVTTALGKAEAEALGFDGDYDTDATVAFLTAASERYAHNVNTTTKDQLDAAVSAEDGDPAHVFEVATESRASGVAQGVATFLAGFATYEAAKQITQRNNVTGTKTWVVTSGNPRSSHAAMNGETVGLDDNFSNGLKWPGAASSNPSESANCACSVTINLT